MKLEKPSMNRKKETAETTKNKKQTSVMRKMTMTLRTKAQNHLEVKRLL